MPAQSRRRKLPEIGNGQAAREFTHAERETVIVKLAQHGTLTRAG